MTWIFVVISTLLGGLLGGSGPTTPEPPPDLGQELVVSWSQADSDVADLQALVGQGTVVIDTEAEGDALVARVPDDLSTEAIETADLTSHVLVAGGYYRCQEYSSVVGAGGSWRFVVNDGDQQISCAWSPYTIDVWSVPR